MHTLRFFTLLMGMAVLTSVGRLAHAQPLLREGEVDQEEQAERDPQELRRRENARERARLEEEQQLKVQQELMRMQGEQMLIERKQRQRKDTMMRYALIIAIAVIAVTILIAYARSRVADDTSAKEQKNSPPSGL